MQSKNWPFNIYGNEQMWEMSFLPTLMKDGDFKYAEGGDYAWRAKDKNVRLGEM